MDSQFDVNLQQLDTYLSPTVRHAIENQFYEKITAQSRLDEALKDPLFHQHPLQHMSLFTDHGLVHVRDVATRTLQLLSQLNGVHFPARQAARLEFMKGYGAMLAYVHDIGILKVTSPQYDMHAKISAQLLYSDFMDKQLTNLWEENSGNVAWRIMRLVYKKILQQPPKHILREMLALCAVHDKDLLTGDVLNHPGELRTALQQGLAFQPEFQWLQSQVVLAEKALLAAEHLEPTQREKFVLRKNQAQSNLNKALENHTASSEMNSFLSVYYQDFWRDSFVWLVDEHPEARELVDDVIDTVRTLRAANASRQRGARLRASGGHQIFLDHYSANAIYAINAGEKLFLLESPNNLLAGEVNLASTEFTPRGNLRISFYRGSFADDAATERAIFNAAVAINEVQQDMLGSFARPAAGDDNSSPEYLTKWKPVYILLENCDDNPHFATRVQQQLIILNSTLKDTLIVVPCLQNAAESERHRYLAAEELQWDMKIQQETLAKIAASGHKISNMHTQQAFMHVKCATVHAGETLMQAGSPASFVYIPLEEGLVGYPLGGYDPFHAKAYIPLGDVGVIRADTRNAQIIAEKSVKILMIPREVYLQYWHTTYTETEFVGLLTQISAPTVSPHS